MKKVVIVITFLSVTAGLTLTSVKKESLESEIRIKNIEALASGEGGTTIPCKFLGSICLYYDENGQPVLVSGLAFEE